MKTLTRDPLQSVPGPTMSPPGDRTATTESQAPAAAMPGSVLLGRFEVGSRIGAGGMGVVYEAIDRQLGAPIALKFLHRSDARALYRLKHEFRAMNVLAPHPNLIAPSGLFCQDGRWFVSMELIRGEPLLQYIRPGHALDIGRARAALVQLALGLQAIHGAGMVHRDLKPSNVLVTVEGRVVILDFGLVSDLDVGADAAEHQGKSGTPRYMAPEQARGEPATEASDFYAVGVMLYEALTGLSPFECDSVDTLVGKQEREPISPLALMPELPTDLARLCEQLLAREPAQRPDLATVLKVLGHAATTRSEMAKPPSPWRAHWVGREAELDILRAALRRTDDGKPQLVLIEGESAVGKTGLVEAFVDTLPPGTVALSSRCHARADVPFKACDELIDELGRFLSRGQYEDAQRWAPQDVDALLQMFPVLSNVPALYAVPRRTRRNTDEQEMRRRGAAALRELLGRIASERPLVLFIDDLQWGDADSAVLLREVLRAPAAPAVLLVGAHRTEACETSEFIGAMRALAIEEAVPLQTLTLGPLDFADAEQLAHYLLGDDAAPGRAAIIARDAGGMPLFVRELSAQAKHGMLGALPHGSALVTAIALRVQALPKVAREVLELVALALAPLPEAVILDAAQRGREAPTSVRTLSAQALLRVRSDGRLDTYHDRVRDSVVALIAEPRRRQLHAALSEALERSVGAQPDWLAAHALAAGLTETAVRATVQAANDAMSKLAFERAASHYRRAIELIRVDDARRGEFNVLLAEACRLDGRGREAGDAYMAAARSECSDLRIDYLRRASEMYLCDCYVDLGIDAISPVLQSLGLQFPRRPWIVVLAVLYESFATSILRRRFRARDEAAIDKMELARIDACYSLGLGMLNVAETSPLTALYLLRGLRLALRAGASSRAAYVQCVLSSMPSTVGALEYSMKTVFEPSLALARNVQDRELEAWTHVCAGMGQIYLVRGDAAIHHASQAIKVCDSAGLLEGFTRTSAEHILRLAFMFCGRLRELGEVAPEHARRARDRADLAASTSARIYSAFATLAADQPDRALDELSAAYNSWSEGEHWRRWRRTAAIWPHGVHALFIQTWALVYRGDGQLAFENLRRRWKEVRRPYLSVPGWRALYYWARGASAIAAATKTGHRATLRDALRSVRALQRVRLEAAHGLASLLGSGLAAVAGDLSAASAHLKAASIAFDRLQMQLLAASASRVMAELEGGDGSAERIQRLDAHMNSLGIASPERWTAMYVPGFVRPVMPRSAA